MNWTNNARKRQDESQNASQLPRRFAREGITTEHGPNNSYTERSVRCLQADESGHPRSRACIEFRTAGALGRGPSWQNKLLNQISHEMHHIRRTKKPTNASMFAQYRADSCCSKFPKVIASTARKTRHKQQKDSRRRRVDTITPIQRAQYNHRTPVHPERLRRNLGAPQAQPMTSRHAKTQRNKCRTEAAGMGARNCVGKVAPVNQDLAALHNKSQSSPETPPYFRMSTHVPSHVSRSSLATLPKEARCRFRTATATANEQIVFTTPNAKSHTQPSDLTEVCCTNVARWYSLSPSVLTSSLAKSDIRSAGGNESSMRRPPRRTNPHDKAIGGNNFLSKTGVSRSELQNEH